MNASPSRYFLAIAFLIGLLCLPCTALAQDPAVIPPLDAEPPASSYSPMRLIEMRPDEKRPLLLSADERNPYAKRSPETEKAKDEVNEEELQIRKRLESLSITGRSQGSNGLRILLGDIILEKNVILPPILPDQTERLRVAEIGGDMVVLDWLDPTSGKATGKTMQIAYDLTPSVSYALHGQSASEARTETELTGSSGPAMGVIRPDQSKKHSAIQNTAEKASPAIPRSVYQAGQ